MRVVRACRELGVRSVALHAAGRRRRARTCATADARRRGRRRTSTPARSPRPRARPARTRCTPATASCPSAPTLAEACAAAGVVFVGPPPDALAALGAQGRGAASWPSAAGVPVVPGGADAGGDRLPAAGQGRARAAAAAACASCAAPSELPEAVDGGARARPRRRSATTRCSFERYLERRAPRRGAGPARRARRRRAPRRARLLAAAPPPEGARGGARARRCPTACATSSAPPRCGWPRRSATSAPAPPSSCSRPTARSPSSR